MRVRLTKFAWVAAVVLGLPVACSAGHSNTGTAREAVPIAPTRTIAELYVAPDGDDDAAGTSDAPLKSISRAAELAKPGTTVRVADGTYRGSLTTKADGNEDARIAFVAENKRGAKVVGTDEGGSGGRDGSAWRNEGDYVDIVGFDISGEDVDGLTNAGSFVRIIDNRVHDFPGGNCITTNNTNYTLHDIDVIGNLTFDCGADKLDHGIYVSHPRGVVANNITYANSGYGIHCWHNCNELTVSNNLVFNNSEGGIVIGQGDEPNDGDVDADKFVVSNNIVVDNGKEGIKESGATGRNNRYLNNLVWDNGRAGVALKTGSEEGTISADPQFVNYRSDGSGDYRLRDSSPAIDAGTDVGALATTIDDIARPRGSGFDIGTYEH